MISKHGIECNLVIGAAGQELCAPSTILVNPAGVALAEGCTWTNDQATNAGTLLHFTNTNTPPRKIAASLDTWKMWVHESSR